MKFAHLSALAFVSVIGTAATAQYTNGFIWQRSIEFRPGLTAGAGWARGNPGPDSRGVRVWSYEYLPRGNPLGTAPEWFRASPQLMNWDPDFVNRGGFWAFADNTSPNINANRLEARGPNVPLVRFTNPLPRTIIVRLDGFLGFDWSQNSSNVDWAIVTQVAATGQVFPVITSTTARPPGADVADVQFGAFLVQLEPSDSVFVTFRSASDATSMYMLDQLLTITIEFGGECPGDADNNRIVGFNDIPTALALLGSTCQ